MRSVGGTGGACPYNLVGGVVLWEGGGGVGGGGGGLFVDTEMKGTAS